MPSTPIKTEPVDVGVSCVRCQHRVDVRGVDQIVCLVHLTAFTGEPDSVCSEFEAKVDAGARRRS